MSIDDGDCIFLSKFFTKNSLSNRGLHVDNLISKCIHEEPIRHTACFARNNSSLNVLSAPCKYQSGYKDCALSYIM